MKEILSTIAMCVERGKINKDSPFPSDLKGHDGADELVKKALDSGFDPDEVLSKGLIVGMENTGEKFRLNKVFLPEVLMSAKAMMAAMKHIEPFFESGAVQHKGVFVIGTVANDLHEIGKNMVSMIVGGAGWKVVDLGFNVPKARFVDTIKEYPDCVVGLSALLTTTMDSMAKTVSEIKSEFPETKIIVGGAPVTHKFSDTIGADMYASCPQEAVNFLNSFSA